MNISRHSLSIHYAIATVLAADAVAGVLLLQSPASLAAGPAIAALVLTLSAGALVLWSRMVLGREIRLGEIAKADRDHLRNSDALTAATSREAFLRRLEDSVGQGRPAASLLLVDVDHFKSINDGFGHAVGDEVLRRLVSIARRSLPCVTIGRLGGDEFALLLQAGPDEALVRAEAFLTLLREPRQIAGRHISIGASIGLASSPAHSSFADELIACADLALYESKRRGRGCATAFDPSMMRDQKHRRFIERELRAAILLDELQLHYQPLVDQAGATVGVEALVRWQHPTRGTIMPGDFIEIAEDSTLIDMLGEWVLRRACRDAPSLPGTVVSINVSGAQLLRDEVVSMIGRVLRASGVPAERFTFEITETVALAGTPKVIARLEAIRALGARISLDDFGTGHTGFQTLNALPVDVVKIDRSYVQAMETDPVAAILVSALGAIGRARSLRIVAEGIETETQLQLAKAAGCSVFQGYLLGRPAPLRPPLPASVAA